MTLSQASSHTVTVSFATADGTAMQGIDYASTSGTLTFAPGVTQEDVDVTILEDPVGQPNKLFYVVLSSPTGGTVGQGKGTGTILGK